MDSSSKKPLSPRDLRSKKPAPLPRTKILTAKGLTQVNPDKSSRLVDVKCEKPIHGHHGNIEMFDSLLYQTGMVLCENTITHPPLCERNMSRDNLEKVKYNPNAIQSTIQFTNSSVHEFISSLHERPNNICDQSLLSDATKCLTNSTEENFNEPSVPKITGEHNQDQANTFGKPVIKVKTFPTTPSRVLIPSKIVSQISEKTFVPSKPPKVLYTTNAINSVINTEKDLTKDNTSFDSLPSQDFGIKVEVDVKNFTLSEFDPLHDRNPSTKFQGVSNRQILDSIIIEDTNDFEDVFGNESKQICISEKKIFRPIPNVEVITIPESQEVIQSEPKSQNIVREMTEQLGSQTECLTIQKSQQDAQIVEFGSSHNLSDVTLSQVSFADKSAATSIFQNEVLDVTPYTNQDSEVQIIEEIRPSTSKPKSSTISKFKKLFGVLSEPDLKPLQQPAINNYGPHFSGIMTWIADDNLVSMTKSLYCALAEQKLFCYVDSAMQVLKEVYKLNSVTSLQMVLPVECSNSLYCFELGISNTESGIKHSSRLKITFGCPTAAERLTWAQKIAANLTSAFPSINYSEFTRLGWCYLKVGVSGEWLAAWLLLAGRELMYYCTEDIADNVDLRKTRCLGTQTADEESKKACPSDCCSNLLLDCSVTTLYLRFPHTEEFQNWNSVISLAAHSNGLGLYEQQLTNEEVPTIVDKCINFIYAYGVLSEGIYRRAGRSVVLAELLTRFRADAWSVQLTPQIYTEHDVSGVFKRFFRDLPTPLISRECHDRLINALDDERRRLDEYQRALDKLSPVSCNTARKLFAHLNFIQKWSEVNKMSAENLAAVWAPTIMPPCVKSTGLQISWSEKEVTVVRDIILNYQAVWCPDEDEIKRDLACHRVIMRMQESARSLPQPSSAGDLRFWVFMDDTSNHFQVSLTPDKTSSDVCMELSVKTNIPHYKLMLEEQICNGSMKRIVHKDEIVLDVVTRWGYWDDEDRKDNNLVIKENKILYQMDGLQMDAMSKNGTQVCGQLRYANDAMKKFKSYVFEVNSSKLSGYADSQGSSKVEEWNIDDIIWYFGHEIKRDPQSRWAITFIPKNKKRRSKEHPYFGSTLAGGVTESQLQWATALMFAQHDTILPMPHDFLQ
ncbi:uncharacterized protein LOC106717332 isoform X2 [Papilio machaon]|uniref:uncharacterized protein LOC106717332 isoform X2 n=1 Tax=Papilio machaon TaxID=76193 RepID=UPI001E666026|nr:uncharacterized protein LOC106717332 isoform X2 [Papilio machaon]